MKRKFTIKTSGSALGITRYFNRKLASFLSLFLIFATISYANNILDVTVTGTDVTCPGANDGTATAIPTDGWAPFTYTWNTGATTSTITDLSPGLYSVTVVDVDLGISSGEVLIGEGTGLSLFMSASYETCPGSADANASVNVSGGTEPMQYLWSTGETFVVADNLSAGTYTVTVTDANDCTAIGSIEVELSPEGVWIMTSSTDADCGLNNGTAHVSAMSGTAPYLIEWSDGQIGEDAVGLAPGTYTVTVTDANDCSNTDSAVIGAGSPGLTLFMSASYETCPGSADANASVNVSGGTEPLQYLWSTGQTFVVAENLSAGTYSVTVTDVNDCSAVGSIEVELSPEGVWIMTSSTAADCGLLNGTAHVSAMSGTAPYLIEWSDGQTGEDAVGLAPGTYTVTVTDANDCSNTESVVIDSNGDLNLIISGIDANCDLSNGEATCIVDGGTAPYTYLWNNGGNTETITGLGAGNYSVTVTDIENCSNTVNIDIQSSSGITVEIISTDADCDTDNGTATATANGGTTPYSYEWSNGENTAAITGLEANETYTVTATDGGGCTATASVTINGSSEVLSLSLTATDVLCNGESNGSVSSIVSGGLGVYTYLWSTGATSADIIGLGTGTYTLTVTDENGCSAVESADIDEPALLEVNVSGTNESCLGSNDGTASAVAVGGVSPYSFEWSNGEITETINGLAPGSYQVTCTDYSGCIIVSAQVVIEFGGITSCSASVTSSYNEGVDISTFGGSDGTASASASGGALPYSYLWSNGETAAGISNLVAGTYAVTITDNEGCSCEAEVTLNNPAKVGDLVWEDLDKDGLQDPGEPGIGSHVVNLEGFSDEGVPVFRTSVTNNSGYYIFDGLPSGNYKITFDQSSGYSVSPQNVGGDDELDSDVDPATGMTDFFDLAVAECNFSIDAGLFQCINIGDFVFYDGNQDGIQQPWEAGYPDAYVRLMSAGPDGVLYTNDDVIEEGMLTGNDGLYLFECVEPGTYYVEFMINTDEYSISPQNQGGDDELDSDPDPATGKTEPITVVQGQADDLSIDAGVHLICDDFTTGGTIGYDQDICPGELPNPLVSITLPSGGFGAIEYLWLQSTTGGPISTWTEIPNSNSPNYAPPQLYQTTYFIRCSRRENCETFVAESNVLIIVVNPCVNGFMQNLSASVQAQSKVAVEWTSPPESRLYKYHLERSNDGISFEIIGALNGQGDQLTNNYYRFIDETPRMGKNIYRVIREEIGTNNLLQSETAEVMFNNHNDRFFVYPNPTEGMLFIESIHSMNENASIELYDVTGKLLETINVDATLGKADFNFNNYASGAYFLKIRYEENIKTDFIKVIKF